MAFNVESESLRHRLRAWPGPTRCLLTRALLGALGFAPVPGRRAVEPSADTGRPLPASTSLGANFAGASLALVRRRLDLPMADSGICHVVRCSACSFCARVLAETRRLQELPRPHPRQTALLIPLSYVVGSARTTRQSLFRSMPTSWQLMRFTKSSILFGGPLTSMMTPRSTIGA